MDRRARGRNVAIGIVVVGLLLLGGIVAVTSIQRGGNVLEGTDLAAAVRAAPGTIEGERLHASISIGTAGALQLLVSQAGTFDLRTRRADLSVTGIAATPVHVITDSGTVYIAGPLGFGGKPWGRVSRADAGPLAEVSGTQLESVLGVLRGVRTVVDRGVEPFGTIRVRRAATAVSVRDLTAVSPLFAQVGTAADAPLEVLLDRDGVPRQIVVTGEAGAVKVTITITISDIGKPRPVGLPPAADVADIGLDDLSAIVGR